MQISGFTFEIEISSFIQVEITSLLLMCEVVPYLKRADNSVATT